MRRVLLPYGLGAIPLAFPDGIDLETPAPPTAGSSPQEAALVRAALDAPVSAPRLEDVARLARTVTVVVPDRTRPARLEVLLPAVLERLRRAGRTDAEVRILVGGGIHAPARAEELVATLGPEALARHEALGSDADDAATHGSIPGAPGDPPARAHRWVAEADLVVLLGAVAPHYLAGFSGGAKALVPGCADRATVLAAHRRTLDATVAPDGTVRSLLGRAEGNPFRALLERWAVAHGRTWLLNVGCDAGRILHASAGDVIAAHRVACADHLAARGCDRPEPADLVVVGGGAPRDRDLVQAHKALVVAAEVARPGAPILWFAHAQDGPGHPRFLPWFEAGRLPRHLAALRRDFHPYGLTAYALRWKAARHPVHVVSTLDRDLLRPMGLLPFTDGQAALDHALASHEVRRAILLTPTTFFR